MRTGIQNDPCRIFRAKLRPILCQTNATSTVCVIQNTRCRQTLYFGENKRSLVLGTSILPALCCKVRINYAMFSFPGVKKDQPQFFATNNNYKPQIYLGGTGGSVSKKFHLKRFGRARYESVATFSLQCKEPRFFFMDSAALNCSR